MYCLKCGTRLTGTEKYCFHCGSIINDNMQKDKEHNNSGMKTASIVLGILSLVGVFLLIFSPFSLILALIGLILAIIANKKIDNVAGIVINAIGLFLALIITTFIILLVVFAIDFGSKVDTDKIPWDDYIDDFRYDNM